MKRPGIISLVMGASVMSATQLHAGIKGRWFTEAPEVYRAECRACHTLYPPEMLAPAHWQRVMRLLPQHYGTHLELIPGVSSAIEQYLITASVGKRAQPSRVDPPRLTKTAYFYKKHRRIDRAWIQQIGSMANCEGCHTGAGRGVFEDDDLIWPKAKYR